MNASEQFLASLEALKISKTRIERGRLLNHLIRCNVDMPEGDLSAQAAASGDTRMLIRSENGMHVIPSKLAPPTLTAQATDDLDRYRRQLDRQEIKDPVERRRVIAKVRELRGF